MINIATDASRGVKTNNVIREHTAAPIKAAGEVVPRLAHEGAIKLEP
jgi:hypothetical protein